MNSVFITDGENYCRVVVQAVISPVSVVSPHREPVSGAICDSQGSAQFGSKHATLRFYVRVSRQRPYNMPRREGRILILVIYETEPMVVGQ